MPAIVRVKRRIDEEPLNAFVLNGKKRRLDQGAEDEAACYGAAGDDEKEEISTVLKFAGTITELDDTVTTQFAQRLSKNEAKDLVQTKNARKAGGFTERAREEMRRISHENRFRVVNCMRTTLPKANDDESGEAVGDYAAAALTVADSKVAQTTKSLTIVDIEKSTNETEETISQNVSSSPLTGTGTAQIPADSDTGYVYDLYYPDDDVQARNADLMDDNYLSDFSVHGLHDIVFEDAFNDARDDDYDSEDSNREDYFTNDYPDEDDELHSANEYDDNDDDDDAYEDGEVGDIRRAVENFVFGDDDDEDGEENSDQDYYDGLSSDDDNAYGAYEDPYVQCIDADELEPDIDTVDVQDFEEVYKRYQKSSYKRHMQRQSNNLLRSSEEPTFESDDVSELTYEECNVVQQGKQNRSSDSELYHSADEQE